jgi:adenosine deaminase CECR1
MKTWTPKPLLRLAALLTLCAALPAQAVEKWFEDFKATATPQQLYTFLYAMPKGGDLHNHLTGAVRSEWYWDAAIASSERGYIYYTKVKIMNCVPYGTNEYAGDGYLLLFRIISQQQFAALDACQKSEYKRLQDLDAKEKSGFLESMRLDESWEGRDEFFQAIWIRINEMLRNPYIIAEILLKNMEAFGKEGMVYLETQQGVNGGVKADGSPLSNDEFADILRAALASPRAKATGVTVRFQNALLRFTPVAEDSLRELYAITDKYRDLFVGVNMVGREDNDKGYPLRFLPVLRELRHKYPEINLSIHAGEVDEPNEHIKDTLLLGATRIGHGVNLITQPDTMLLMRNGPYMVEINLVSNLLLEYVSSYKQHPFPEYLRTGIPVALSTDDRGMWDSNLTDEFFIAVKEFNLSWDEVLLLSRNSLKFSFLDPATKAKLTADYERRVAAFVTQVQKSGIAGLSNVQPVTYSFTCKHYKVCFP